MKLYKLTDANMRTFGGFQWALNRKITTSGAGNLCGPGWIHCYENPLVAVFMNPVHADFDAKTMRLFEAEVCGVIKRDGQLKCGVTECTLVSEISVPRLTTDQRVEIAIRCALVVYRVPAFTNWAQRWLDSTDRTKQAAAEAAGAARAAEAAGAAAAARAKTKPLDLIAIINAVVGAD